MRIAHIRIGTRVRRDHGDIESLAANIADIGMLQPVVVTPNGVLIAGQRRLEAAKRLGWTDIPARVVDIAAVVRGEFSENTFRKDFTLSEAVAIKRALEPLERAAAKERQREHGKGTVENFSTVKGRALDKVAAVAGKHRTTIAKAEAIVVAADAEPEKYGKLREAMDKTGRVNGPYKRLRVAKQAEKIRAEPPPLPRNGPYRVIVVDPPWPYEIASEESTIRGVWPYPTLTVAEIAKTDIASIAHDDAILWLWTTNFHMQVVFDLLKGWGFQHRTILTWAKDHMGAGDWLRGQTEQCVMAIRGKPIVTLTDQTTLLRAPVRRHSEKPREFYDLVERLCPAPRYADLFSRRRHSDRWDCHGDEAPMVEAAE
jgi:N6-adenosine-specific RNA methylase IME4/ParB-like chromosome segregation protein Spo0J